jgi:exosome complex component CSL4
MLSMLSIPINEKLIGFTMKEKIVFPGDKLSTSEELLAGDGTFEDEGIIRAARLGKYEVNTNAHAATVKPFTSIPVMVQKGDTVLAEVRSVRSSMIIADVIHVIGKKRDISGDTNGTLHISEISSSYVKDPESVFSLGDVFRAKVIQVDPSLQLTTKGASYGVIKAFCTECRNPLERKKSILECAVCGHKEKRKTAQDYGEFDLSKM